MQVPDATEAPSVTAAEPLSPGNVGVEQGIVGMPNGPGGNQVYELLADLGYALSTEFEDLWEFGYPELAGEALIRGPQVDR